MRILRGYSGMVFVDLLTTNYINTPKRRRPQLLFPPAAHFKHSLFDPTVTFNFEPLTPE